MATKKGEFMTAAKPPVDNEQSYLDSFNKPMPRGDAGAAVRRLKADALFGSVAASGKGKTPMADAYDQACALMIDYQSLITLPNDEDGYEWAYVSALLDQSNVGIAFSVKERAVYVFATDAGRPETEAFPYWLLDMAKQLTDILQTFVVPDQGTDFDYWGKSPLGRDVLGYKFKMADSPASIMPAGTESK
jgi:hypothetical protein